MPTVERASPGCRAAVAEGFDTIILHGDAAATGPVPYGPARTVERAVFGELRGSSSYSTSP